MRDIRHHKSTDRFHDSGTALKTTKTGQQRALVYSTYAAMAQGGGDIDPEMSRVYQLLNKDCKQYNRERKERIVRRVERHGHSIDAKDVNLLQMEGNPQYESVNSSSSSGSSNASGGAESDNVSPLEGRRDMFKIKPALLKRQTKAALITSGTGFVKV
jgi:hypothetical protein